MSDLWPDFNDVVQEENNAIKLIREQARILGKKLNNKVKATFSKVSYNPTPGIASAIGGFFVKAAELQRNAEEILEEDLQGKIDVGEMLRGENYKFEIYSEKYRFRLFIYHYTALYPNTIILDENIAEELGTKMQVEVNNDSELMDVLQKVFSSHRIRRIIGLMIAKLGSNVDKSQ